MNARLAGRIETGVELLASALLAGAVAFAGHAFLDRLVAPAQLALVTVAGAAAIFVLCSLTFRWRARASAFQEPAFELPSLELFETEELLLSEEERVEPDELVLSEADRYEPSDRPEPLILDDVLAELDPDSRVVRLFDRKSTPTPGQLQSRIDHHLGQHRPVSPPQDASQALSDALAELKRSLR